MLNDVESNGGDEEPRQRLMVVPIGSVIDLAGVELAVVHVNEDTCKIVFQPVDPFIVVREREPSKHGG